MDFKRRKNGDLNRSRILDGIGRITRLRKKTFLELTYENATIPTVYRTTNVIRQKP